MPQPKASVNAATRQMMRLRGLKELTLTVEAMAKLSPQMRRVMFSGAALASFEAKPGQDLVLMLPNAQNQLERRHYTVRTYNALAQTLTIDFVLHAGESVAMRWLIQAREGDSITAFGPRGRNVLQDGAEWRLFVGDETGLPGIGAMLEALTPDARAKAFIEVPYEADRQHLKTGDGVDIVWLPRGGPPQPPSAPLIQHVKAWTPPGGAGHVYLLAETSAVRAIRHDLIARGIPKSAIFAEGYWRPGRVGGHDHV